jgi:hypothetical protein
LLAFPFSLPFKGRNVVREGFDKSFRGFEEFPGFRNSGVLHVRKRTHPRGVQARIDAPYRSKRANISPRKRMGCKIQNPRKET